MMTATVRFTFEAAHNLKGHPKCGRLHGHSYQLCVTIETEPSIPISGDFGEIKRIVREHVIEKFDHQYLNDLINYPSAERIVWATWDILAPLFKGKLVEVGIGETRDSWVTFRPYPNPAVTLKEIDARRKELFR